MHGAARVAHVVYVFGAALHCRWLTLSGLSPSSLVATGPLSSLRWQGGSTHSTLEGKQHPQLSACAR